MSQQDPFARAGLDRAGTDGLPSYRQGRDSPGLELIPLNLPHADLVRAFVSDQVATFWNWDKGEPTRNLTRVADYIVTDHFLGAMQAIEAEEAAEYGGEETGFDSAADRIRDDIWQEYGMDSEAEQCAELAAEHMKDIARRLAEQRGEEPRKYGMLVQYVRQAALALTTSDFLNREASFNSAADDWFTLYDPWALILGHLDNCDILYPQVMVCPDGNENYDYGGNNLMYAGEIVGTGQVR